jgi:hypothetical protein
MRTDLTMKILIGAPIHESKDYCLRDWIMRLRPFDADLFLVDNSPDPRHCEKVIGYIHEAGITRASMNWLDIRHDPSADEKRKRAEGTYRISLAREEIRKKILEGGYDAWFSLESDVFVPSNAIKELLRFIFKFHAVHHSYPFRQPEWAGLNAQGFGCSLIQREALEKFGFADAYGNVDPLVPDCWQGPEAWFNYRVLRNGWRVCDLHGVIKGIEHK